MNKIYFYSGRRRDISSLESSKGRAFACGILCFWVVLFCSFVYCFASQPLTESETKDRAFVSNEKVNELKPSFSGKKGTNSKSLKANKTQKRINLNLPVPANVDVSPHYSHPILEINFAPAVSNLKLPKIQRLDLIKDIRKVESSTGDKISSLKISLKKEVQFLLSRTRPNNLQIKFVAVSAQASSSLDKGTAAGKGGDQTAESLSEGTKNELKDLRFTQNDQGSLFIRFFTRHKISYRPQPEKKKRFGLVLSDIEIPSDLSKIYDLKKFKAPVKKVVLRDTPKGGRVEIFFSKRAPISIKNKENLFEISIQNLESDIAETSQKESAETISKNKSTQTAASKQQGKRFLYPEMKGEYTGKKISLDLQNADVEHVLRLISEVAGYNLIIGENVGGKISLKLEKVPWDQALDLVLIQKDLGMVKKKNILRVATLQQLQEEQSKIEETRNTAQKRLPLHTEYIQINYTSASEIKSNVEKFLSKRGKISVDQRTNQLIVSDTKKKINKIREVVQKLDRAERQVLIEARLVYATDTFQRSLGLQWGGGYEHRSEDYNQGVYGASGTSVSVSASPDKSGFAVNLPNPGQTTMGIGAYISKLTGSDLFTLDAKLQIGESKGQVKTISSPRVVTLNNQEAEMVQGTKISTLSESESGGTTVEYTSATLNLTVTPQITPNNKIILDLNISDDSVAPGGGKNPDIETRKTNTKVIVDDKETIVLGGVREITQTSRMNKVPWFADIPVFGWLFKNELKKKDTRELLIFIRPKILSVS